MGKILVVETERIESIISGSFKRVRNEKVNINKMNWTPNQYTGYLNLYIKTVKRAVPNP